MNKFLVGMKLGTLEITKVTEKIVYLKVNSQSTFKKKRISEINGDEYIELDLSTLNWLGLIDDENNVIDIECLCKSVGFKNKFRHGEMSYRFFAKDFQLEEIKNEK